MLLTRECDYAIRLVRALSRSGEGSVTQLCGDECVPQQYAYKILKKLERSGIVRGYRGPQGGYRLLKSPLDLTLLDIVTATEDKPLLSACLSNNFSCPRNSETSPCSVHSELCRLQELVASELSRKNLSEVFNAAEDTRD
jgi:Rrf2 family protein